MLRASNPTRSTAGHAYGKPRLRMLLLWVFALVCTSVQAAPPGELLLFPDVTAFTRSHEARDNGLKKDDIVPALDLFYSLDHERLRFLAEYLFDKDAHAMERFQLGVRAGEPTLWLGRFHNPIGYWNSQYHHGAHLQASATRPGIVAFEGGDGPLPMHLTGVLVEGIQEVHKAGLHYTVAAGLGPQMKDELLPFDVLDPEGSHRFGATLRLSYQPVSYGADEVGVSLSYTNIPADTSEVRQVRQWIGALFANWQFDKWRALGELIYVHDRIDLSSERVNKGFLNAYAQLEWLLNEKWTLFGRLENTFASHEDQYLDNFSKVVRDRALIGTRFNFYRNMALKLEVSRDKLESDRFNQVMLQWSAVFP
jgi:hypothetical protein